MIAKTYYLKPLIVKEWEENEGPLPDFAVDEVRIHALAKGSNVYIHGTFHDIADSFVVGDSQYVILGEPV